MTERDPAPDGATILRDRMAVIRTALANERTLLAYVRTALALVATGIGLLHLFRDPWLVAAGWITLPLGILVLLGGIARYVLVRSHVSGHSATDE